MHAVEICCHILLVVLVAPDAASSLFQITDFELKSRLRNYMKNKKGRAAAVTFLRRTIRNQYVAHIMKPLVASARNGTMLLLKNTPKDKPILFVPLIGLMALDSKQAYDCATLTFHRFGTCNCRFCLLPTSSFWDSDQPPVETIIRNAEEVEFLSRKVSEIELRRMRGGEKVLTDQDKAYVARAKYFNIIAIDNPLFQLFHYQGTVHHIINLIEACAPDKLHTIIKGIIEYALRWSISTIYLWGDSVDMENAVPTRDPIAVLDSRAKSFQCFGSFHAVGDRTSRLNQGFSYAFRDTNTTAEALKRGVMTGGCMDAQRIVQYLYQLAFCIGTAGSVIPNRRVRFDDGYVVNPTEVALSACFSALEVYFAASGDVYSEKDVAYLEATIELCNNHLLRLFRLKAFLLGEDDYRTKVPSVIKPHLCTHFGSYIRAMGAPRVFDVAGEEHKHIADVHKAAQRSGNRASTFECDMLRHDIYVRRSKELLLSTEQRHSEESSETLISEVMQSSDVVLRFFHNQNSWTVCSMADYRRLHFHPCVEGRGPNSTTNVGPVPMLRVLSSLIETFLETNGKDRVAFASNKTWREIFEACKDARGKYQLLNCRSFYHSVATTGKLSTHRIEEQFTFVASNSSHDGDESPTQRRRFDFADVAWLDDDGNEETEYARIVGILCIAEMICDADGYRLKRRCAYLPLICWLIDAKENSLQTKKCPFPYMKYNILPAKGGANRRLFMQMITTDSISLPAVGMHDVDLAPQSNNAGENTFSDFEKNRFRIVPLGMVRKFRRNYNNLDYFYMYPQILFTSDNNSVVESSVEQGEVLVARRRRLNEQQQEPQEVRGRSILGNTEVQHEGDSTDVSDLEDN